MSRDGGDAGYRPRVRSAYCERVYVHSPEGQLLYRGGGRLLQRVQLSIFEPKKWKNGAYGASMRLNLCENRRNYGTVLSGGRFLCIRD